MKKIRVFSFIIALFLVACGIAKAGTLNLQLEMKRWDVEDSIATPLQRNIVYFVIDCSGSMTYPYEGPIKKYNNGNHSFSREQVLFDLLEERWDSMPQNAEVFVYLYRIYDPRKPFFDCISGTIQEKDRKVVLNKLKKHIHELIRENGLTPYFHTLSYVFESIKEQGLLRAGNVNLMVYDYTDGLNYTAHIRTRFPSPDKNNPTRSAMEAEKEFLRLWGPFKQKLMDKGCYEPLWLGEQNVKGQSQGMKPVPEYTSSFKVNSKNLKNPNANATQDASSILSFLMSKDNWKLLCGSTADIVAEIDGKAVATKRFTIKDGKENIALELPLLPDGKTVSLRVICPESKDNSFKLKSPRPVVLEFPPMEKITLASIDVIPGDTVRKGEEITFVAKTNGTNVEWDIDGEKAKGKTVTHKHNKVGKCTYRAVAVGDGFKPSNAISGSITVIDIGIVLKPQAERAVQEQEVTFAAIPVDGAIKPDRYVWTCTGPVEKEEETDTMTLPGNTATIKHKFLKAGTYKIRATALYDSLPTLTESDEKKWTVDSRPTLVLSDRPEDKMVEGRVLRFGETFSLVAIATGGILKDDIVWFADGKEIPNVRGASIQAPVVAPTAGKAKTKVTYFARAKDRNGNVLETQKVSFSFTCGHAIPKVLSYDKNGTARKDFTRGEEMRFTLEPEDKYTDIAWDFGDGSQKSTGAVGSVVHTFQKGGTTYDCKVTCKCRDCHVELTAEPAQVQIDSIQLVNTFQIKAQKSCYAPKDTITLEATGKGFSKCTFWRKIGRDGEWKECEANNGTASIPDTLPDKISDVTYKLVMLDMDGNPNDESNQITVGVRIWWLAIFFLLIAAIIWYVFKIFWSGNEPRGWTVYGMFANERPDIKKYSTKWDSVGLSKYWSAWQLCKVSEKKGLVNISELGTKLPDDSAEITSTPSGKTFADIHLPPSKWKREPLKTMPGEDGGTIAYAYFTRNEPNSKINGWILALAVEKRKDCITYTVLLILLALAFLGVTLWLCFQYAF